MQEIKEGTCVKVKRDAKDIIGIVVQDSGDRLVTCKFPNLPPLQLSRVGLEVVAQ